MKKHKTILLLSFILLSLIFLSSCTKPNPKNPFDPQVDINVKNLTYERLAVDKIELSWDNTITSSNGIIKIDKKVGSGNWQESIAIFNSDETTWTDTLANINQNLKYRIYVLFDENQSNILETDVIDNTFPTPTNLIITQDDVHTFSLIWNDNSIGEQGFHIKRKIDTGDYILIHTNAENDTTYIDDINTREQFEIVYYRINAFAGTDSSAFMEGSNAINFPAPTNLNYEQLTISSIKLDWQDNSNGEEGFIIERKIYEGDWIEIATVGENVTEFTDDTLGNYLYFYRVWAFSGNFYSVYSEEIICVDIVVPWQYSTIQPAIDSAADGDIILVFPGTYVENINYKGKNITVASLYLYTLDTSYISQTIIDGNQNGSVVTFNSGEDTTAILTGFTIQNGNADHGGGIRCSSSSSPSLENVTISNNSATGTNNAYGGGIYCDDNSSPSLDNVTITGNSSGWGGSGIYCHDSSPSLENVTISNNSATGTYAIGGGIRCSSSSSPSLENVTISNNSAYSGGGISCLNNSSLCLENVTISNNLASLGGGIYCHDSSPGLENVTISNNSASYNGGGIFCNINSSPSLVNVTITGNSVLDDDGGGGISCLNNSSPSLVNCILWNDSPQEIYVSSGSVTATYSNIQGGWTGTGNINANPLFIGSGNFHLQPGSHCIDAGNPDTKYNDPKGKRKDMGEDGGHVGEWEKK